MPSVGTHKRVVKAKRDWRFEALRIFSMLLIVMAHFLASDNWAIHIDPVRSTSFAGAVHSTAIMSGQVGVTLFVLISAFFLVQRAPRFSVARVIKLWIQVFAFSVVILLLYVACYALGLLPPAAQGLLTAHNVLSCFLPITENTCWFVSCFAILLLFSPFTCLLLRSIDSRKRFALTALLVLVSFIWKLVYPAFSYNTDVTYLLTVFVVGGSIGLDADRKPLHGSIAFMGVVASVVLCFVGTFLFTVNVGGLSEHGYWGQFLIAGKGSVPLFSVIAGTCIFLWVLDAPRIALPSILERLILFVSPATLGIYLFHTNPLVSGPFWSLFFSHVEPVGLMGKAAQAIIGIPVAFLLCLVVSLMVYYLVVMPILKMTSPQQQRIISYIDRLIGFEGESGH